MKKEGRVVFEAARDGDAATLKAAVRSDFRQEARSPRTAAPRLSHFWAARRSHAHRFTPFQRADSAPPCAPQILLAALAEAARQPAEQMVDAFIVLVDFASSSDVGLQAGVRQGARRCWRTICLGDRAACLAVVADNAELLAALLDSVFRPRDVAGFLSEAAMQDAVACFEPLVAWLGADLAASDDDAVRTALFAACDCGSLRAAEWLCERGVPVNAADPENGATALMVACGGYRYTDEPIPSYAAAAECVRLLLRFGADPHARGHNGFSALVIAVDKARFDCAALLLDHGASGAASCGAFTLDPRAGRAPAAFSTLGTLARARRGSASSPSR